MHDLGGEIRYWNRSAERVFGWVREEVQGQKVQNLLYENPGRYETALKTALAEGAWIGETTKRTKAGRDVLIECRWTLVRDEAGQPKSIFAINTDITEKKEIEARFFRSQRLESIGSLAGGIAHDLNNVFGPIIMAVDLFKLKMTDPQQIELPGNGGLQRAAGRGDGEAGAIVCARSGEPEGVDLPAETRG